MDFKVKKKNKKTNFCRPTDPVLFSNVIGNRYYFFWPKVFFSFSLSWSKYVTAKTISTLNPFVQTFLLVFLSFPLQKYTMANSAINNPCLNPQYLL